MNSTTAWPTTLTEPSLKHRFKRAASWSLLSYGATQVLRLGSNLVLARLLAPEMFGVIAVANLAIIALVMLSDVGLGAGAIRSHRGDDPTFLNVTWVVQIVRGAVITAATLCIAGALALAGHAGWLPAKSVYADPLVPQVIAVLSVMGLVMGLESTKVWSQRRNLALARLTKIELISQVLTTVIILAWAAVSPSVWALAGGGIVGALLRTLMTHTVLPGPANRLQWDGAAFKEIMAFGKWTLVSSPLTFLLNNGDRLLLASFLDARAMGFYSIAFLLVNALHAAVGRLVSDAALPALSEVFRSRPEQLKTTLYRIRRPLDIACLTSAGALAMLGQPIVNLLYDVRYASAGWMLSALALTLVAAPSGLFDQCLIAMGRPKRQSVLNALRLVALYTLVPLGFWLGGIEGAVAAVAACALVNVAAILVLQHRMGLLDAARELRLLPLFAFGLLAGWLLRLALPA